MENSRDTLHLHGNGKATADQANGLTACKLARLIGKPYGQWTADDLIKLVRDQNIRLVSLMHIGGDGWLKTLDFVPRDSAHLRDILTGGERCDGSSIFSDLGIPAGASDIVLRPRPESAFLDPFSEEPVLVVMCSHLGRDGRPLPESPDTILRAAYERLRRETGIDLHALGEIEYFIGMHPTEHSPYGRDDRGYHASSPFVFGEKLRRQALVILAEMGIPIKYGHSEVGYVEANDRENWIWEQHEIELQLQPLPLAADGVVLTQWVLRNLAHQSGMLCTFDPVIRQGHAGNGMHFHMAPWGGEEYKAVTNEDGKLTTEAQWLISGLVRYGGVLMAFGNRGGTSFLRLTQGKEAPNTVTWGRYNRKALVRLPIVPRDNEGRPVAPETVEFRLPDGSAHPHLLLAGIAQVMTAGHAMPDMEGWIQKTATDSGARQPEGVIAIPKDSREIAESLNSQRAIFQDGTIFPPRQIDAVVEALNRL